MYGVFLRNPSVNSQANGQDLYCHRVFIDMWGVQVSKINKKHQEIYKCYEEIKTSRYVESSRDHFKFVLREGLF